MNIDIKQLDSWDTWEQDLENSDLEIKDKVRSSVDAVYNEILLKGLTLKIGSSMAKDSTVVTSIVLLALMRAKRNGDAISSHHYLVHVDTGIENPEVRAMADEGISQLKAFIKTHDLPLQVYVAKPSLTSSWPSRVLGGRGLPTFVNTKYRQCSHELKINPANKVDSLHKETMNKEDKANVVLLLGSRDLEGSRRASSIANQNGQELKVTKSKDNKKLAMYVIKSWTAANVWEFLTYSGDSKFTILPSYQRNFYKLVDLYRDSGGGECVIFQPDDELQSALTSCQARHGCAFCLASGTTDKSMISLLESDSAKYSYMKGLNRVQQFLAKSRYDWSLRHVVGRTIYDGGYIKIQPDVYSPKTLKKLLHAILSYDYLEQQRAASLASKLVSGQVEDNEFNQQFSKPQFQIIDERQLIAIEFLWSMHHFQKLPFEAIELWHKVYTHNELELLEEADTMPIVERVQQPKPMWLKVDTWADGSNMDGLSDFWTELTYFDSEASQTHRVIKTNEGNRRVVDYVDTEVFDVDLDVAKFIVWNEYKQLNADKRDGNYKPYYSTSYLLRMGAVTLGKGQSARYHTMAQRGQAYHRMGVTGDVTMESIANDPKLKPLLLNDSEYKVLAKKVASEKAAQQEIENAEANRKLAVDAKRKAWVKANKAESKAAKRYKLEYQEQRKLLNEFKTLFILATNIHANMQNMMYNGEEIQSITRILVNLKNEISTVKSKFNKKFDVKSKKYQLLKNKEFQYILNTGDFDLFESDHIKRYAESQPLALELELKYAIEHLVNALSEVAKPVFEVNGYIDLGVPSCVLVKSEQAEFDFA